MSTSRGSVLLLPLWTLVLVLILLSTLTQHTVVGQTSEIENVTSVTAAVTADPTSVGAGNTSDPDATEGSSTTLANTVDGNATQTQPVIITTQSENSTGADIASATNTRLTSAVSVTESLGLLPVDTDETAAFIYSAAGFGVLMVVALLIILARSFYVHRGSYDLKRQRALAEQHPKPSSPASPTQFAPIPLSVYNDTTNNVDNRRSSSKRKSRRSSSRDAEEAPREMATVANTSALNEDTRQSQGEADGRHLIFPGTLTGSTSPYPPQAPTVPHHHLVQQTPQGNAENLRHTAGYANGSPDYPANTGTLGSNAPLIERTDSSTSERPTPKERASLRKKRTKLSQMLDEGSDGSRPAPRPRASVRSKPSGHQDSPSSAYLAAAAADRGDDIIENEAVEQPEITTDQSSDQASNPSNDDLPAERPAPEGSSAVPYPVGGGVMEGPRIGHRMPTRPPPKPPSVSAATPPLPPPPPPPPRHTRPSLEASTTEDAAPATLPPETRGTVPFMHFDLTQQHSGASAMSYAAKERPDSYVIDL